MCFWCPFSRKASRAENVQEEQGRGGTGKSFQGKGSKWSETPWPEEEAAQRDAIAVWLSLLDQPSSSDTANESPALKGPQTAKRAAANF